MKFGPPEGRVAVSGGDQPKGRSLNSKVSAIGRRLKVSGIGLTPKRLVELQALRQRVESPLVG